MKNVTRVSKAAALRTIKNGGRDERIPYGIHIIMPEAAAKKWLRDLRSGTFIQDEGSLHCPSTGGFCCLGVQQYGALKGHIEVETDFDDEEDNEDRDYLNFPSLDYLKTQGIAFLDKRGQEDNDPYIPSVGECVSSLNDALDYSKDNPGHGVHKNDFAKMADYIESTLAVY